LSLDYWTININMSISIYVYRYIVGRSWKITNRKYKKSEKSENL